MNYQAINATRQQWLRNMESARISEVARQATELQSQGLTRTQALQAAERLIPHA